MKRKTSKKLTGSGARSILLFASGALFFSGCAVWHPIADKTPIPEQAAERYAHYYDYPPLAAPGEVVLEEKTKNYTMKRYEIPLSLPPGLEVKNLSEFKTYVETLSKTDRKTASDLKLRYVNRIDYYIPRNFKPGQKRPAILISPILGGNMVVDHFAKYYAGRGYLAAIVHRKRTKWDNEEGIEQIEDYLRTSVIRLRESVDWLSAQPEVDPEKIGAFGISYGAILHSVLAAVEPRIRYHVLAMPAAPLADVIMECPDKAITKMVKGAREKYGWPDEKIHQELKARLVTDPIYLSHSIPRDRVELYIALFDRVVGARRSFRLWKAMGRPKMKILPFGHYGGVLILPYLETTSYQSFKRHLKNDVSLRGAKRRRLTHLRQH